MNAWHCVALVSLAGAVGGGINALLSDNGFIFPTYRRGIWCPGALANVVIGSVAALVSWALYGSGAGIDVGNGSDTALRAAISLKLPALAGALLVGVAGAKWLTSEADKGLLKESIKVAGQKDLTNQECEKVVQGPALKILERVEAT